MRRCLIGDLMAASALLARLPASGRAAGAERLLQQADAAHRYAKRFGRPHPSWGNGSLMARALADARAKDLPPCQEARLEALGVLVAALLQFRATARR